MRNMPTTDFPETSSSSPSSLRFSISSRRRDQVHTMDPTAHEPTPQEIELDSFQRKVSDRFHDLAAADSDELLSIPWLQKLLEAFLSCQEEFRLIVSNNRTTLNKPPMDKYISDFFDRSVKALDVCNAIRDGIEQIRQWQKHLEIVVSSFDGGGNRSKIINQGQFRRAKKALIELLISMLDEKESAAGTTTTTTAMPHRNRSFGRHSAHASAEHKSFVHLRSLSWSVSRSWSAARQLLAIGNNLVAPRANEITSTNGLNLAVFTMNYVLLFVMWALVAAIPCQDRGLQTHFNVSRQLLWAPPILSLHDRILEESKKRERRNACGLLKDIRDVEICARCMMNDLADSVRFPLTEEKEREIRERVDEIESVYQGIKDGLDPLEKGVREVFHRIVRSRNEGLASIDASK
ncbi:hypothetical protein ABFS83_03G092200 [Erythranthe nasuta]